MISRPCPAKTPSGRAAAEHRELAFFLLEKIFYFFVKKACILPRGVVIYFLRNDSCKTKYPGVAKFGIALEWGSRGRWFESSHSDHRSVQVWTLRFFVFGPFPSFDQYRLNFYKDLICYNASSIIKSIKSINRR